MSEDRRRILNMLKEGKISVAEADELLSSIETRVESPADVAVPAPSVESPREKPAGKPRFLRVLVEGGKEKVDVRIPLQILRAGIKFGALIPQDIGAKINPALEEKGINLDLSNIKPEDLDEFIQAFCEMSVDVKDGEENVRVFCE